jgi:hypothetical protein
LHSENDVEPDLTKYYPVSEEIGIGEFPDITLKNISLALIILGLIAFMINALMVYLFMRQEWAVIWPRTSAAQAGVVLMSFGVVLYLINRIWERRFR